jgi:hypothetical protein
MAGYPGSAREHDTSWSGTHRSCARRRLRWSCFKPELRWRCGARIGHPGGLPIRIANLIAATPGRVLACLVCGPGGCSLMIEKTSAVKESRWSLALALVASVSFVAWIAGSFAVSNLVVTLQRLAGKLLG